MPVQVLLVQVLLVLLVQVLQGLGPVLLGLVPEQVRHQTTRCPPPVRLQASDDGARAPPSVFEPGAARPLGPRGAPS